jgi:hypothetical protein
LPELAAEILASEKINLLYDQLFVKEPKTPNRTRWHNDQPYWAMRGWQVLSFWIALDPVDKQNGALEFIPGSHRWGRWFQPEIFGKGAGIEQYERNLDYEPMPDIESARERYEIISWDLSPGDVYVFHALTVHGAGGNSVVMCAAGDIQCAIPVMMWCMMPDRGPIKVSDPIIMPMVIRWIVPATQSCGRGSPKQYSLCSIGCLLFAPVSSPDSQPRDEVKIFVSCRSKFLGEYQRQPT